MDHAYYFWTHWHEGFGVQKAMATIDQANFDRVLEAVSEHAHSLMSTVHVARCKLPGVQSSEAVLALDRGS